MASRKSETKTEPRIYVLFVFELNDKCKITKIKHQRLKNMFLAAKFP